MGQDDRTAEPIFTRRHLSDVPIKFKDTRISSRSTSCSSSRSDSPVLPNGQLQKSSNFIPKPKAFVASVTQKLSTNVQPTNDNKGINRLPKFNSTVLAGTGQATKRVHPSSTTSPPHSPHTKRAKSTYVPNFAPTRLLKSAAKKLDFGQGVSPNASTPALISGSSSASNKSSVPQNEISCIPDYLGAAKLENLVENTASPPLPIMDFSALSELPDEITAKPNLSTDPVDMKKDCNGVADEFTPITFQDILSSPPKPERVTTVSLNTQNQNKTEQVAKQKSVPRNKSVVPSKPNGTNNVTKILNSNLKSSPSPKTTKKKTESLEVETQKMPIKETQSVVQAIKAFRHIQWSNKDALCWLDVSMNLLVHSRLFHSIVSSRPKSACPVVKQLLECYSKAQALLKQALEFKRCQLIGQKRAVVLETSVGMVSVKTGGGDGTDILPDNQTPETLVVKTTLSPLLSPTSQQKSVMSPGKMEVTTQQLQTRSDQLSNAARDLLVHTREAVWGYLHPKLKCQKGENDSPVFALPLLLGEDPVLRKRFTNDFEWRMTCTECGHKHIDK